MFERFTEKARRVVFFARYEASQFGSPFIETEHLLLALLRENKHLLSPYIDHPAIAEIRREIEASTTIREKVSTEVDLPLSNESKRILAYAAEEAECASHAHIGTEHLLAAMLREERSLAASLLTSRGVMLEKVREQLHTSQPDPTIPMGRGGGGGWGGGGAVRHRPARIDFVCGGETINSSTLLGIPPRIGEHVILTRDGKDRRYRVEDVCYRYDTPKEFVSVMPPGAPGPPPRPPLLLTTITVEIADE